MKIRRMRFVLPARMRPTAEFDARMIAKAAARALPDTHAPDGSIDVQIQGGGRPAQLIARDISREVSRKAATFKREG